MNISQEYMSDKSGMLYPTEVSVARFKEYYSETCRLMQINFHQWQIQDFEGG